MSDDKYGDSRNSLTNENYDDYNYDDYNDDYKYEDYDDDYSLTDDDTPLTSASNQDEQFEKPLERVKTDKNRSPSRRETIKRVAEDQLNGTPRKPGVTPPDSRLDSIRTRNPHRNERYNNRNERNLRNHNTAGNRPAVKTKFAAFYIALLFLAVCVCLTVLVVVLKGMDNAWNNIPMPSLVSPTPASENMYLNRDMRKLTALVTSIEPYSRTLSLLDISTQRTSDYTLLTEARLQNRNSGPLTFAELRIGDMVDIDYDTRNLEILTLKGSSEAWERSNRTDVSININNFQILLGNEAWTFNSQTLVLYRGEPFPISQISAIDSVTMRGVGDTVWLVQLDAAHGYLQLTNTDMITNGRIMIGTNLYFLLDDIERDIDLPEGTYRIMVEGDNIETLIENIEITQGQTTRFNLADAPLRAALLNIAVTPEDAEIFVNDELHENIGPAQIEFGENIIRVEREGYHPQEQVLDIREPISSIVFELVPIVNDYITLSVFTVPSNAEIYIDFAFAGYSTLTRDVTPGTYTIIARMNGYIERRTEVIITGNETEDVMTSLLLMPVSADPMANQPPHDVAPLPGDVLNPLPTVTPTPTPLPTNPPPINIDENPDWYNQINPTPTPTPSSWWEAPPPGW